MLKTISNLEKGYAARVDPANSVAHQTLVRQMNWLDRNMETLLQQAPAPTVRFISNTSRIQQDDNAPVKQFIDATSKPIPEAYTKSVASSSKPIVNHQQPKKEVPVRKELPAVKEVPVMKETPIVQKVVEPPAPTFSKAETAAAEKRRRHEFRQIQTRFCDTFKTVR